MRRSMAMRSSFWLIAALAGTLFAFAHGALANTPACDEIVQDPTISTCTCICEASSLFAGCQGLAAGTAAPTPNQCPDMLQGRRVISGGDAVVIADPHISGSSDTIAGTRLYKAENDSGTPGLGVIDGTPVYTDSPAIPCQMGTLVPFPQPTRFARLFDLPYDMIVTLRPPTDGSQLKPDCFATSSTAKNLTLVVRSPNAGAPAVPPISFGGNPRWFQLAIDDFDYDGFDDIVFLNIDFIGVWSAADTADPTKGLVFKGGAGTDPSEVFQAPINEPTTGDFNGDGLKDVAWIGGNFPNQTGTLSVFFATVCPGDIADTVCAGAEPFEIILDPASKLFPGVSGATSTIVLDNAPLTPTRCGVAQSAVNGLNTSNKDSDVLRAGSVVLGNFEDNGVNGLGAPTDELVVVYVSGSGATGSDPCSTDLQYWTFSSPPNNSNSVANRDSWAKKQSSAANLFPEITVDGGSSFMESTPTISVYGHAAYLDWYGPVEQAVIGVTGSGASPKPYGSFSYPITVSVSGTGDQAKVSFCSAPHSSQENVCAPYVWGSAVGRLSTSTTVNSKNPTACSAVDAAAPGDCPYNPQIAMLLAMDSETTNELCFEQAQPPQILNYTVQRSEPNGSDDSLKCANDPNVSGFLPKLFNTTEISDFQPLAATALRAGSGLRAGDAFGNSVRVGNPTIARISQHTQPQMVIQTPPSLIDYVLPNALDSTAPAIVNFTRAPGNYNTQIQFQTESSDTSAASQATSHSTSFTESIGGEAKFGIPLIGSIDATTKESWSQYHESNTSSQFSNYVSTALETGGTIGADDQVWWTQTTFNVFNYPVIGETVCPASLTCDVSDPSNIICDGGGSTASAVELTCAESGDGCHCLSADTAASQCPAIPGDPDARSCTAQGGDVCCSQLQQQLFMTLSGPEEVTRKSQQGATAEFYHPRHEPGQILSYPSNLLLLQARLSNPQELATLDKFSTGTNSPYETITYASTCEASEGVGTTNRHSFESDTSITAGTPGLSDAGAGVNVTAGFDYGVSTSIDTLNSYTVGQTASSSVQLNLQGSGFLNPNQYAYDVEGIVYGQVKPADVLDTPDLTVCPINDSSTDSALCNDADKQAAGCTTTGPLQVGYAADPTAGDGGWWASQAPYLKDIDVALNNPSRWVPVQADQVANADLQCRGDTCYAANQPPTATDASSVWDADFYDMKGLLVTNGGTSGPQRDSAEVGDEIFLQARVYNYSLKTMDAGTKVYARFYRQQLDVNDNNGALSIVAYAEDASGETLTGVPIGPKGLGDSDPIPVVSPEDGSATIPPFNTTSDPANDNISVATTSYIAAADDACEYDNKVQNCNGAYYAYWVTVWAEDANGNLITELPGHGLNTSGGGAFEPAKTYDFITDVPLETVTFNGASSSFSNNAAMFKKVFAILPDESAIATALANAGPTQLRLDLLGVAPHETVLGEPVVVSARVVSHGAATPGATVVFSGIDPEGRAEVFDTEWLPHIRAEDAHFTRATYNPRTCGTHEIFVEATGGARTFGDAVSLLLDVGIDSDSAIGFLISEVKDLQLLPLQEKVGWHKGHHDKDDRYLNRSLILKLRLAKMALAADRTRIGVLFLRAFNRQVKMLALMGRIDAEQAEFLVGQSRQIIGCIEAM